MATGISETKIMSTISDEHSLNLFRTIALAKNDNGVALTSKTKELTRKQYYSRMSRMIKVGLVKRKNGKYSLTSLGKVVHESGRIIEEALKEYWKLRAIDSIQTFGAVNGYTTETYKSLHKEYVKVPYRLSNKKNIKTQIMQTVSIKCYNITQFCSKFINIYT